MTRILILALIPLLLGHQGGCADGSRPPVHVAVVTPAVPGECLEGPIKEPKLPDGDVSDDEAARDREALKRAFRAAEARRRICRAALESRNRRD